MLGQAFHRSEMRRTCWGHLNKSHEIQPAEPDDRGHAGVRSAGKLAGTSGISASVGSLSRSGIQTVRESKVVREFTRGNWRPKREIDYAQRTGGQVPSGR